MNYMEAIAVIVGVMLFLWGSAVLASGLSFLVTDGRLGRREWYQVALASAIIVACIIGFVVLDMDATLPPPESETAPPAPETRDGLSGANRPQFGANRDRRHNQAPRPVYSLPSFLGASAGANRFVV